MGKTYLMRDNRNGYHKIGYSKEPFNREKTLQSENPDTQLLFFCNSFIETELHNTFKTFRIRGEWFNLTDDQVLEVYNRMKNENGFTVVKK